MADQQQRVGVFIGPVTWNIIVRPALSLIAGALVTFAIWLPIQFLVWIDFIFKDNFLTWWMLGLITLGIGYYIFTGEEDSEGNPISEQVPDTMFGALLTFFGGVLVIPGIGEVYRLTGTYSWTGKKVFLGRTTKVVKNWTDGNGFVQLGPVPIQIWNNSDQPGVTLLSNIAKNQARVFGTLTLVLRHLQPRKGLDSGDPTLDVADRARQAYRELCDAFTDTDIPTLHRVMGPVLRGQVIFTSFIPSNVGEYKAGSMIRDDLGLAMYRLVAPGEDEAEAQRDFLSSLASRANPDMLKRITKKVTLSDGTKTTELRITRFHVSDSLERVIEDIGSSLPRATFGDVDLSDPVKNAAEQASAETNERASQLASAETNRLARQKLMPSAEELTNPEAYQLATVLQAAADSKNQSIKVVLVPGNNRLASAAVAGATQIGG